MRLSRSLYLLVFLACALLMVIALYMEHVMGLEPCPLCMLQRVAVIAVGVLALIAALHGPAGVLANRLYAVFIGLFALIGAGLAGRQLWLQSLPADQVPACGPSVDYLLEAFPLLDVVMIALQGTGDCAKVSWTFLGLSIPGWTFIAFVAFLAVMLFLLFRRPLAAHQ
jgi:disulfide bond formation protein DsbB